ncbi:MAG: hypothetical protein AAF289_02885 [Cyanobacteria bacterium P01_A01_bin.135]
MVGTGYVSGLQHRAPLPRSASNDNDAMLGFLTLVAVGSLYYFIVYPYQKIRRMRRTLVVQVPGAEARFPGFPLGNIGIFANSDRRHRVRVIFPTLAPRDKVEYVSAWYDVHQLSCPTPNRLPPKGQTNLEFAQELSFLVHDHVRFIEPEIQRLQDQRTQICQLRTLVATSDIHAGQQGSYDRALEQVNELLQKAEELQFAYVCTIREILIGRQVAAYDPSGLPPDSATIDSRYMAVREEYEQMKAIATAHTELLQLRRGEQKT